MAHSLLRRAFTDFIPPSHRRRGATAVLVRHKPQWHRHDRRGSAVVPSLIAVAPPKSVKTADIRGGTAETFNMFRRASAVLPPSHRRRGATAVAPPKTVKTADLRGGTAETFNMFKTSEVPQRVGPIRSGVAAAPPWPPWHRTRITVAPPSPPCPRSSTSITAVSPQYHLHHRRASIVAPPSPPCLRSTTAVQSRKCRLTILRRSRGGSTAVKCVTGRWKLLKITGGVTTVMAVLIKNRGGTAPPVWRSIKPPCNCEKVDWLPYGDPVAVLLR